jgi:hypothetical protein
VSLAATWNEYLFPSHPWKSSGVGLTASVDGAIGGAWTWGGAYRFVSFATLPTSTVGSFTQNEGYLDAGYTSRAFGLTAHGAVVADGTGAYGTSPHAGLSLRWSPAGDLLLDGAVSGYSDGLVARGALRWRIPVAGPLSVTPGFAAQDARGSAFAAGSLGASLDWERASVWVGGKYGEEVRPAYLESHVVYDVPEHVLGGAWAGVRARILPHLGVVASYAFDWLRRADGLSPSESSAHAFALGPIVEL